MYFIYAEHYVSCEIYMQACLQLQSIFPKMQVNVLPSLAEAYVNLRIHSAHSLQEVGALLSNGSLVCHVIKMKALNKMYKSI